MDSTNGSASQAANLSSNVEAFSQKQLNTIVYNCFMAIAIVLCNSLQAYVFASMKIKSFSNVLFMSIALSDALFGAVAVPLFTVKFVFSNWPLGLYMCYFNIVYIDLNFSISNYWLFMLSMHRFLSMVQPYGNHEKVTCCKIAILLTPLIVALVYISINLVVHVYVGDFNSVKCGLKLNKISYLIDIILYGLPITFTILTNLANIIMLYKKSSRAKERFKKPLSPRPKQKASVNENSGQARDSMVELSALNQPAEESSSVEQKPQTSSKRQSEPSNRRQSKGAKSPGISRDKKAVLCIVFIVVNTFVTEYFSFIVYLLGFVFPSAHELYNVSIYLVYTFPLLNPILVFIFHDPFRKELMKKIERTSRRCKASRL